MRINRRILIYGNSDTLGTIGSSLRCRHCDITTLAQPLKGTREIPAANPDIRLFELETTRPSIRSWI